MMALVAGTEVARLVLDAVRLAYDIYQAQRQRPACSCDVARIAELERQVAKLRKRRKR